MRSEATTVDEYIAQLPADRREAVQAVRQTILKHLPKGYEEGMQYGMIGYYVPHSLYPAGYHCDPKQPLPFAGLVSQKNHMALYLMCIYGNPEQRAWFSKAWTDTGRKLDMGKACVRFRNLEAVPLNVVGQAIKRVPVKKFVAYYESVLQDSSSKRTKKKVTAKKKSTTADRKTPSRKKKGRNTKKKS